MKVNEIYELLKQCDFKVCTDTRTIIKGSLFIALKGNKFNANDFIDEAFEKGCRYAIGEEYKGNNPNVFVVTDSLLTLQQLAAFHRKKSESKSNWNCRFKRENYFKRTNFASTETKIFDHIYSK